jgi:hypothetical protein
MAEHECGTIHEAERENRVVRTIWGFVAVGVALRLIRYLQNFPMWCDETMLASNLLDRSLGELAQPLDYRQVAPLGFLALEWLAARGLGFSEGALRLVPMLSAVASVPLFALLARRVLGSASTGTLLAVATFAVATVPIRYAGEVKPYSIDLLVGVGLLWLTLESWREPEQSRWTWALAIVAPIALAVSLPSVFIILAIVVVGLARGCPGPIRRLAPLGLVVLTTGIAVMVLVTLGQYQTEKPTDRAYFLRFWAGAFPPGWERPTDLLGWMVTTHTGPLFAYPHGEVRGLEWLTVATFAAFVAGILGRWRREPWTVALLVLPLVLSFLAAVFRRYPYGMNARVSQFLVPSIVILAAAGIDGVLGTSRRRRLVRWAVPGLVVLLAGFGLWRLAVDLSKPYRTPWDRTAREFARWFWEELAVESELVCVWTDLGIPFTPRRWAYDGADQYLCFQRIYSKRHRQRREPRWEAISDKRPLRCVLINRKPEDLPEFQHWIEARRDRYQLRSVRAYPATRGSAVEPALTYVVCEFVPVPTVAAAREREPNR